MQKAAPIASSSLLPWLSTPKVGHLVQFYYSEEELLDSLSEYIGGGLNSGDTCILIATKDHLRALDKRLAGTTNKWLARRRGQYITLNAKETMATFMVRGAPDWKRFVASVGTVVDKAAKRGKPIRAFGEMVALLWKEGNQEAVVQLENFWNKLAETYEFSLYCAYPRLHFDTSIHGDILDEINHCHTLVTPKFAARRGQS